MTGHRLLIEPGDQFSHFTVIKEAERVRLPSGQTNRMILCRCECGAEKIVRLVHLKNNKIRSCGCVFGIERHGESRSLLYNVFRGMKTRCYSKSANNWHLYGGKGITICDEWRSSFTAFKKWAMNNGWEHGLNIDRINGGGNYEPSNCRMVTPLINACNISTNVIVKYEGEMVGLRLLVESHNAGKDYSTIRARIKRGWSAKRAIETPIKQGNYKRKSLTKAA